MLILKYFLSLFAAGKKRPLPENPAGDPPGALH